MATLDEIQRAGLKVAPTGAGEQIMNLIGGIPAEMQKQDDKAKQDLMDQVKLYSTLREAGYSAPEAHDRVTRTYRSHNFIEQLVTGKQNDVFNPPSQEDKVGLEQQKTKAEIAKLGAETTALGARAEYLQKGGARQWKNDRTTPLPGELVKIVTAQNADKNSPVYKAALRKLGDMLGADPTEINHPGFLDQIKQWALDRLPFNKPAQAASPAATAGKFQVGQTVNYKGKPMTISKILPDGRYELT